MKYSELQTTYELTEKNNRLYFKSDQIDIYMTAYRDANDIKAGLIGLEENARKGSTWLTDSYIVDEDKGEVVLGGYKIRLKQAGILKNLRNIIKDDVNVELYLGLKVSDEAIYESDTTVINSPRLVNIEDSKISLDEGNYFYGVCLTTSSDTAVTSKLNLSASSKTFTNLDATTKDITYRAQAPIKFNYEVIDYETAKNITLESVSIVNPNTNKETIKINYNKATFNVPTYFTGDNVYVGKNSDSDTAITDLSNVYIRGNINLFGAEANGKEGTTGITISKSDAGDSIVKNHINWNFGSKDITNISTSTTNTGRIKSDYIYGLQIDEWSDDSYPSTYWSVQNHFNLFTTNVSLAKDAYSIRNSSWTTNSTQIINIFKDGYIDLYKPDTTTPVNFSVMENNGNELVLAETPSVYLESTKFQAIDTTNNEVWFDVTLDKITYKTNCSLDKDGILSLAPSTAKVEVGTGGNYIAKTDAKLDNVTSKTTTYNNVVVNGVSDGILKVVDKSNNEVVTVNLNNRQSDASANPVFKVDGGIQGQYFNQVSDIRKKKNIESYTCDRSILDLDVKKFDFINGKKNNIGCIAQDLQEICPEIVHEDFNGYLSIEETKIVYLLLNEVKELKKEIEELKKR